MVQREQQDQLVLRVLPVHKAYREVQVQLLEYLYLVPKRNLLTSYIGIEFDTTPDYTSGGIWTVTAPGTTVGTYITSSASISAFISYGFTIDDSGAAGANDNVWVKVQKDNGSLVWTDIPNSIITNASPSATPVYYHSSGTCMISIEAGQSIRCVVDTTDTSIDLNSGTNGDTYLSIFDMFGGEQGPTGVAGATGVTGPTLGADGSDGATGANRSYWCRWK